MQKHLGSIAAAAVLAALAFAGTASAARPGSVRAAFFANWDRYGRAYVVKDIPANDLNVIDYAFATVSPAGTCALTDPWSDYQAPTPADAAVNGVADSWSDPLLGNFRQLQELKALHPGLRVEMSIGGWGGSHYFSDAAATAASRQAFVASCIDLIIKGNVPGLAPGAAAGVFDGINVDWEYPGQLANGNDFSAADRHNATLLLQEFRRQLDALGGAHTLTVDIPGGNVNSTGSWELKQVAKSVDWVNMMSFDYHGSWDPLTDFNSPFGFDPLEPPVGGGAIQWTWNTVGSALYFLENGVPAGKLVVGVPFYGKEYVGVGPANNGLYQPHGAAPGNDSPTYHDLVDTGLADANLTPVGPTAVSRSGQGLNGFTKHVDLLAGAPWLYDPALNGGTFISYVDPGAVRERIALVDTLGLRGAFAWEISNDDNANDLANALASG